MNFLNKYPTTSVTQGSLAMMIPSIKNTGALFGNYPTLVDTGIRKPSLNESSYFIGPDGQLYYTNGIRPWVGSGTTKIQIRRSSDDAVIATPVSGTDSCFGPSICSVIDSMGSLTYYIAFCGPMAANNNVYLMSSNDLIHWTTPVVVSSRADGYEYFNVSITYDSVQNRIVAALEENGPVVSGQSLKWTFFSSPVGSFTGTWSRLTAQVYGPYSACPCLKYRASNNKYYFTFLSIYNGYSTFVGRASYPFTAGTPKVAAKPLLVAAQGMDDGSNKSDYDHCEIPGVGVLINYINGDQSTWSEQRYDLFTGTLEQYYNYLDALIDQAEVVRI